MEQLKLDLDARQYIEIRIGAVDYKAYAPPMSKTPEMAKILKRIEEGAMGFDDGSNGRIEDFVGSIADFVSLFSAEIPREKILALDLSLAMKCVTGLRALLPKGAPSPAPAAS